MPDALAGLRVVRQEHLVYPTPALSLPLGLSTGIVIGFVMPAVALQLLRAHDGWMFYNMDFTAGLNGTLVVAVFVLHGSVPVPVFICYTDKPARWRRSCSRPSAAMARVW